MLAMMSGHVFRQTMSRIYRTLVRLLSDGAQLQVFVGITAYSRREIGNGGGVHGGFILIRDQQPQFFGTTRTVQMVTLLLKAPPKSSGAALI